MNISTISDYPAQLSVYIDLPMAGLDTSGRRVTPC